MIGSGRLVAPGGRALRNRGDCDGWDWHLGVQDVDLGVQDIDLGAWVEPRKQRWE